MKLYDVTVAISNDLPVYPGDPAIEVTRVASLEHGAQDGRIGGGAANAELF